MDKLTAELFQKVTPDNFEQYPNKRMWDNILSDAELNERIDRLPKDTQELLAMRIVADRGTLDITRSHDLQQGANDNMGIARTDAGHVMNRALDIMGSVMRHSEFSNRRVAILGTLRINRENGRGYMESIRDAEDLALRTQYDYSRANRQPIQAGNFMKVLTQIQSFRFHSLGFMVTEFNKAFLSGNVSAAEKAEARRVLGYQMFTTGLYAGALGTPLGWAGVSLANMLMNLVNPDEPFDAAHEAELFLQQFGEGGDLANTLLVQGGVPKALGVDIAKRTMLASVFQSSVLDAPEGMTGNRYTEWVAAQMLGPSWTNFSNLIQGGELLQKGEILEANKKLLPALFRDWAKAIDVAQNGVRSSDKTVLLPAEDVTLADYALMFAGLQPTRLSNIREENRAILDRNTVLSLRRSKLINDFMKARDEGDDSGADEAIDAIYAFNQSQAAFAIGKSDLQAYANRHLKQSLGIQTERYRQIQQQYNGQQEAGNGG